MYREYSINTRKVEREFKRKLLKKGYFQTARGFMNYLVDYGKDSVLLRTDKSKQPIKIYRKAIRKAISFFYFKRTIIREDMKSFSNFFSAVFAMMYVCFDKVSKLQVLKNGLFRLSLFGTRFFASGLERDPAVIKVLKELNGKYVLFNYLSILESPKCLDALDENNLYCLIDSGAFTLHNKKKKDNVQQSLFKEDLLDEFILEGYARFINAKKQNPRIIGFLPLDCVGNAQKTKENYKKLKSLTDATIFPVWQCTDSMEELDRIVEEEPEMIAIGGLVPFISSRKKVIKEVLQRVTSRYPFINFHLLGVADELLLEFNVFSADSTAFLNARKYEDGRKVYLSNGERVDAPQYMSVTDVIRQNLKFLLTLEDYDQQMTFNELIIEGA